MTCRPILAALALVATLLVPSILRAQRHSGVSAPPTAPPPAGFGRGGPQSGLTIAPVSSGLGPIQFVSVNYGVPAPQSLTRQLRSDDERTRAAALSAVGAPGQYLQHGHIGLPRSLELEFAAIGTTDDLDAILTIELDQHLVTAVLLPDDSGNWHRIATLLVADSADDPRLTPATFAHTAPSTLQHGRYHVVFHADSVGPHGNYIENEAHLRIFNNHAVVTMSFASASLDCTEPAQLPGKHKQPETGCAVMRRWLEPDPTEPFKRFTLVTASGRLTPHEAADPLITSPNFQMAHAHTYTCQPFMFSDTAMRYEPVANSGACP